MKQTISDRAALKLTIGLEILMIFLRNGHRIIFQTMLWKETKNENNVRFTMKITTVFISSRTSNQGGVSLEIRKTFITTGPSVAQMED